MIEDSVLLKKIRETFNLRDIAGVLFGSVLLAFAVQVFIIHAGLLSGGIMGIAILINYGTGWNMPLILLVLNLPIFVAGLWFVSKRFALYSLLGLFSTSFFIEQFARWNLQVLNEPDVLINGVLGGILIGVASGMVLRCKGSVGGMDVIAVIIRRFWGFNVGEVSLIINIVIVTIFAFIGTVELSFYSGISMFIAAMVVDKVISGISGKTAMIITENPADVSQAIITNLRRGCTFLTGYGAYTGESRDVILVTMNRTQLPRLREIVTTLDPNAFIIVNDSTEVFGKGFTSSRFDL